MKKVKIISKESRFKNKIGEVTSERLGSVFVKLEEYDKPIMFRIHELEIVEDS